LPSRHLRLRRKAGFELGKCWCSVRDDEEINRFESRLT